MAVRNSRRRFTFEALERRDTPTAGLHGVHHLVRPARPIALHGTADIALTSSTTGSVTDGRSNVLGNFEGTITNMNVTLNGDNGTLNLFVTAKLGRPRGGRESFHGTFRVVSGTVGGVALAGGQGTINGLVSASTESGTVTLNGKLRK
jgi:hypothetical protein